MVLASTWMDPVLGLDVHLVMMPTPAGPVPTPMPMPFVGMVYDPMGLVIGAAIGTALGSGPGIVLVNGLPATNVGTAVMNTVPHLPVPGIAFPPPKPPSNDAELMFGGLNVGFGGSFAVRLGEIAMSCSDPIRMPTSVVLAIPKGMPVLVLRPPALDIVALVTAAAMKAGMRVLGALLRGAARAGRALFRGLRSFQHGAGRAAFTRLSRAMRGNARADSRWSRFVCFLTGHPVDVATGRLLTDKVDFTRPGPLPMVFERQYDTSASGRRGSLGYGWTHSLEEAVWQERGCMVVRRDDGREVEVSTMHLPGRVMRAGDRIDDPFEGFELRCTAPFRYELETRAGVVHEFAPIAGDPALRDTKALAKSKLLCRRTLDGHRIELAYDSQARLQWVRDSTGRRIGFEHDARNRLTRVSLPAPGEHGYVTHRSYHYSEDDDLVEVKDSQGASWSFDYVSHLMVQERDRAGVSFYFQYDGHGPSAKCVRTWGDCVGDDGRNATRGIYDHVIAYDTANKRTIVENSCGEKTVYEMDISGQVVSIMDSMGGSNAFRYDPECGKQVLEVDPLGNESRRAYNSRGDLVSVTTPDGAEVTVERDARGRAVAVRDALGAVSRWAYNEAGRATHHTGPDGSQESFEWRDGLLVATTSAGRRTVLSYDEHKQTTLVQLPNGAQLSTKYDERGRPVRSDDPRGGRSETRYDSEDRVVERILPTSGRQLFKHDAEGNVTQYQDANRAITFRYGHYHRLLSREEAGTSLSFVYDTEDRLREVINEQGEAYRFELDLMGQVTKETTFDGARTMYLRDIAGRVTKRILPSARVTETTYDSSNRPVEMTHSDGSFVRFEYDKRGGLVRAESESADVRYERDVMGRVTRESQDGGVTWVSSRYALDGSRRRMESTLGAACEVELDRLGLPSAIHLGGGVGSADGVYQGAPSLETATPSPSMSSFPSAPPSTMHIERDLLGAETRRQLPGGLAVEWERDAAGRPTARRTRRGVQTFATGHGQSANAQNQSSAVIDELAYLWRGDDQIAAIIDPMRGPRNFDHDARGRLVRETRPDRVLDRAMDAVGNVYRSPRGRDRRYGEGGVLLEADGVRFEHDADGNQVTKVEPDGTTWKYAWNGHGMLAGIERHPPFYVEEEEEDDDEDYDYLADDPLDSLIETEPMRIDSLRPPLDGPLAPPDLRLTFAYDAFARRVSKSVVHLLADGTEVTADETHFVWDGHVVVHEVAGGGVEDASAHDLTTWYWDPGSFTPIAKEQNGKRWSIASDHLGTPTEMYDEVGELAWKMQLDVFGVAEFEVGEAEDCPWRWPGQYEDEESGDYYNRWRYYDARSGTYVSQDPIGLVGGARAFGYVADTTSFIDPFGLIEWFTRLVSEAEALASAGNLGGDDQLHPRPHPNGQESRGPKWITAPGEEPRVPNAKGLTHRLRIGLPDGTRAWLQSNGISWDDVDGGEKAVPNHAILKANESGSFGVGRNLLNQLNERLRSAGRIIGEKTGGGGGGRRRRSRRGRSC